MLVVICL